ncbi:MAG: hypothetical protein F6J86_27770 [Symploca sp. SIO1B1]|nr:hypothetical protein [Symploca sp. SIO1C2]NER97601.1 hypothetical protein [Symploca sp. SIO1B1]
MKLLKKFASVISFCLLMTLLSAQSAFAAVDLFNIPTTNTLDLRVAFLNRNVTQASLSSGEAKTLSFRFDELGIGSGSPTIYEQETPGDISIPTGNLAFVERSVSSKIALRYGAPGGTQKNIVFVIAN